MGRKHLKLFLRVDMGHIHLMVFCGGEFDWNVYHVSIEIPSNRGRDCEG